MNATAVNLHRQEEPWTEGKVTVTRFLTEVSVEKNLDEELSKAGDQITECINKYLMNIPKNMELTYHKTQWVNVKTAPATNGFFLTTLIARPTLWTPPAPRKSVTPRSSFFLTPI